MGAADLCAAEVPLPWVEANSSSEWGLQAHGAWVQYHAGGLQPTVEEEDGRISLVGGSPLPLGAGVDFSIQWQESTANSWYSDQLPSQAIRGHQGRSEVISGHSVAIPAVTDRRWHLMAVSSNHSTTRSPHLPAGLTRSPSMFGRARLKTAC